MSDLVLRDIACVGLLHASPEARMEALALAHERHPGARFHVQYGDAHSDVSDVAASLSVVWFDTEMWWSDGLPQAGLILLAEDAPYPVKRRVRRRSWRTGVAIVAVASAEA